MVPPCSPPPRSLRSRAWCRQGRAACPDPPGDERRRRPAGDKRSHRGREGRGWQWGGGEAAGHGCPPTATGDVGVRGQGGALPQVSQAGRDTRGPGDGHRPPALSPSRGWHRDSHETGHRPSFGHLRVAKGGDGGDRRKPPPRPRGNLSPLALPAACPRAPGKGTGGYLSVRLVPPPPATPLSATLSPAAPSDTRGRNNEPLDRPGPGWQPRPPPRSTPGPPSLFPSPTSLPPGSYYSG